MTDKLQNNEINPSSIYRFRRRSILQQPSSRDLRAKVFEDRDFPGSWRVEKLGGDGANYRGAIFSGRAARERSIRYADREHGDFELAPCPQQTYRWPEAFPARVRPAT